MIWLKQTAYELDQMERRPSALKALIQAMKHESWPEKPWKWPKGSRMRAIGRRGGMMRKAMAFAARVTMKKGISHADNV